MYHPLSLTVENPHAAPLIGSQPTVSALTLFSAIIAPPSLSALITCSI
jgi:hypothetical protein